MAQDHYAGVSLTWLVDKHKSADYRTLRGYPVSRITIHCAAGRWPTIQDAKNCIAPASYTATWNYAISDDGNVGFFLSEKYRPWTSSNRHNDHRAITMEVSCGSSHPYEITDAALGSIINLCEDICIRHQIPGLYYTGDISTSNLTLHRWFSDKQCPGKYIIDRLVFIANSVNDRLKRRGVVLLPYTDPVSDATYSRSNYRPAKAHGTINWDDVYEGDDCYNIAMYGYTNLPKEYLSSAHLCPYIATLNRNSVLNSDTAALASSFRTARISGAVLEAGYLYDATLTERPFRSPVLYEQMRKLDDANIPYGLWTICRAKTIDQANKEMAELRPCVQLAKVNLGVWLDIKFSSSSTIENNDVILNTYKTKLHAMGLAGKIGLYITAEQLKQITWEDHCNDWLLWLVEHLPLQSDLDILDNLLIPDFWNVEPVNELADQAYDPNSTRITFGQAYPFPDFGGEQNGVQN